MFIAAAVVVGAAVDAAPGVPDAAAAAEAAAVRGVRGEVGVAAPPPALPPPSLPRFSSMACRRWNSSCTACRHFASMPLASSQVSTAAVSGRAAKAASAAPTLRCGSARLASMAATSQSLTGRKAMEQSRAYSMLSRKSART